MRHGKQGSLQTESMAADGFAGAVSLELHPDALNARREDAYTVGLLAGCLRRCREWEATGG